MKRPYFRLIASLGACVALSACGGKLVSQPQPVDEADRNRGEIFQGGDDILVQLEAMGDQFFRQTKKLATDPDRYPVCRYTGCPAGATAAQCEARRFAAADTTLVEACETFVEELLPGWLEPGFSDRIRFVLLKALVGANARVAETRGNGDGILYFEGALTRQLLREQPLSVYQVVIHEIIHNTPLGELGDYYPADADGGRERIDLVSLALAFFFTDSRDLDAYLVDNWLSTRKGTSYITDWGGLGEIWLRGRGDLEWYYLLPNGALYRWVNDTNPPEGTEVARLSPLYHQFPDLLHDAARPDWIGGVRWAEDRLAAFLDTRFRMTRPPQDHFNAFGLGEKWITTVTTGVWYYVTPDGGLNHWTQAAGSTFITTLPTRFYQDTSLLHEAGAP